MSRSSRLGVQVGRPAPDGLRALITACSAHVRIVDAVRPSDGRPPPRAVLWFRDRDPAPDVRVAVWAQDASDVAVAARLGAVVVSDRAELLRAGDLLWTELLWVDARSGTPASDPGGALGGARPVLPSVRRRIRAARGLLPVLVARGDGETWSWYAGPDSRELIDIPPGSRESAPALASAVVATGAALLRALAWAAPTVTDPRSAAMLGARDDVEVVVLDEPSARRAAAGELAADDARAARLGWAGRRLVETRHDRTRVLIELADHLRVQLRADPTRPGVQDELDWLGVPEDSRVRARLVGLTRPPATARLERSAS